MGNGGRKKTSNSITIGIFLVILHWDYAYLNYFMYKIFT